MAEGMANFASSTLSGALNNSATSFSVANGSSFPSANCYVVIGTEIMRMSSRSSNTLTVIRGQEGTSAVSHNSGDTVSVVITVQGLKNVISDYGSLEWLSSTQGTIPYRDASAWAGLAPGTSGNFLQSNGSGSNPSYVSITSALDNIGTTRGSILYRDSSGWTALTPGTSGTFLTSQGSGANPTWSDITPKGIFGGRLSLGSGTSVMTTNGTNGTLYAVPYEASEHGCGVISNYENGVWVKRTFTNTSISLTGTSVNECWDIYGYFSSGTFTLQKVSWTNTTTRAAPLGVQDGVYVHPSDSSRLYLGTILPSSSDTGEFTFLIGTSRGWLGVWNMYNRILYTAIVRSSSVSWTYASATWRQANNSTNSRVLTVTGVGGSIAHCRLCAAASCPAGNDASMSISDNISTFTPSTNSTIGYVGVSATATSVAMLDFVTTAGARSFQWVEARISGSGTNTYYGTSSNVKSEFRVSHWC